ncbi:MAG: hypothetical protein AB7O26_00320 [Planctomycetaceae bacterium]
MTKSSLALVTIVSAIPGAFLACVLVGSLMTSFSDMPTMFIALVGLALLAAAAAALMPVGIMVFGGRGGASAVVAAPKPAKEKKSKKEKAEADAEPEASDAAVAVVSDPEVEIAAEGDEFFDADEETEAIVGTDEEIVINEAQPTGELSVVEGLYTEDNLPKFEAEVSDANIEVLDAIEEDFDFSDDDDDSPPPPKKKKR